MNNLRAIPFHPTPDVPLYRQLYVHLRRAILNGELKGGTKLPSTRALAEDFNLSRNTVLSAYRQLKAEGYLESDMPGILRSAVPLVSASAVMWVATLAVESPVQIPRLGLTWAALLFMGILGSGLAFVMAYYLIHEIGPTRTTMVTYLFPLGGVLLGVAILHEPLTWQLVAGAALIITSLAVVNWEPVKHPATSNSHVLDERERFA